MVAAEWSECGGSDCLRVTPAAGPIQVRPRQARPVAGLPAMAGKLVRDGEAVCFVPRYAFLAGTTYDVLVDGLVVASLLRPTEARTPSAAVMDIYPTAAEVPRNLLRLYVQFSAPMSEGFAARCVRLEDEHRMPIAGALLATSDELWDVDHRRVTLLLDPARIKRGLISHREVGYPLKAGKSFRVVVDADFRDAEGIPLTAAAERIYGVAGDERRHVDPAAWRLVSPAAGTTEPLRVAFDRPLDRGLLNRCIVVAAPDGSAVSGMAAIGPEERSWILQPAKPWRAGDYVLRVAPILEDLAGNSLARVFDRDLARAVDDPRGDREVMLRFAVG